MNDRGLFYFNTVNEFILNRDAAVLVCGGGVFDKEILRNLNFTDVTITNLDTRVTKDDFLPYKWKFENAENLSYENESFDYVIIHAAIHHAASPHRVLTEMYRVAKKGILAVEARDSVVMRLFEKLSLTQTYESTMVFYNECKFGGVNNSDIPNYIYRWTEREIEKTIRSYAPYCKPKILFKYGTAFPYTPQVEKGAALKLFFIRSMRPFFRIFTKIFPKQQNLFAFFIEKPNLQKELYSWLTYNERERKVEFNRIWGERKFKKR